MPGPDRHRIVRQVHSQEFHSDFLKVSEAFLDELPSQVPHVQHHIAVDAAPFIYLGLFGARYDVSRCQLEVVGRVLLHETVAVLIQQVRSLSARRLRHQNAGPRQRGGVILDHLHVHHGSPGPPCQRHAIPGADDCVGGRFEDTARAPSGDDHRLGADRVHFAGLDVQYDCAPDFTVLLDEGCDEPLFVHAQAVLDRLLVKHVQHRGPGNRSNEEGPCYFLASEPPCAEPSLRRRG